MCRELMLILPDWTLIKMHIAMGLSTPCGQVQIPVS